MRPWWQEPAFWRELEPFLFPPEALATADDEVADLLDWLEPPEGGPILDVGCGIGRHLIPLARRGYAVVGADSVDDFRRRARQRLASAGLPGEVRAFDAFGGAPLVDDQGFDAILCAFAIVGYHDDPVYDAVFMKNLAALLRPGGRIALLTRHPEASFGRLKHNTAAGILVEDRRFDRPSSTLHTTWTITRGGRQREHRSRLRVYPAADLRGLFEFCELEEIQVLDRAREQRIITLGRRPKAPPAA